MRNGRFGTAMSLGIRAVLLLLVLCLTLPGAVAFAQGNGTTVGSPTVVRLTRLITIQAPYTGDDNASNSAVFQYKKTGDAVWLNTFPMYIDRASKIWHGVAYGLDPNTSYDLRLTLSDADGVAGSPWTGTVSTKADGTRPLGTGAV